MPSASIADKITARIVQYERGFNNIPFDIYDASGGIGGSTLSFLDRPEVRHVYTYEIVPERRAMEKVNVEAYNFQNKWTSYAEYTGTPETALGSVTYFDPPWLPENVTGLNFEKSQYIQENTMFAGKLLEDWVRSLTQCSLVVFRVPPGYRFKPVQGWRIDVVDDINPKKRNVRLIFCVNLAYPKTVIIKPMVEVKTEVKQPNVVVKPLTIYNEVKKEFIMNEINKSSSVLTGYNGPTGVTGATGQGRSVPFPRQQQHGKARYDANLVAKQQTTPQALPQLLTNFAMPKQETATSENKVPIESVSLLTNQVSQTETQQWEEKLRNFLIATLSKFSGEIVGTLIGGNNWKVWVMAFTEDSFDPVNNYDVLENLGDAVLENAFTDYLMERLESKIDSGEIAENGISNLRLEYLSKPRQSELSNQMGLPQYVRLNKNISVSIHIAEDLFEAFFGALFKTGNNIKKGLGYVLSYNLIKMLFDSIEFSVAYLYDPSKTFVIQTFSSLGWGNSPQTDVKENPSDPSRKYTFSIFLTEAAFKYLQAQNFPNVTARIGTGVASTKKTAESIAYSDALMNMINMGITNEWISAQKFSKEFNTVLHPELAGIIGPLRAKMAADDIIRLVFEVTETNLPSGAKLLQLKGYKRGYQRLFPLGSTLIPGDEKGNRFTEQHLELLRKYING
jgi:dsRNA-specific ribonuclease